MVTFERLTSTIEQTHLALKQAASRALNHHLTLRNWLIGFYIVEFEQKGQDRAIYGEKLLANLAKKLCENKILDTQERELRRFRKFYLVYNRFGRIFYRAVLENTTLNTLPFWTDSIRQSVTAELSPLESSPQMPTEVLLKNLSFTHFVELATLEDSLKRTFYELECIKGCWGVRELKRQMGSLYYERTGLSQNPDKLSELTQLRSAKSEASDIIKSVYMFEFLGLQSQQLVEEKDLEAALLNHLQAFLLELGNGFCFEARQKKILIGDDYFFVDLVFYHRILKCHVLVELKVEPFNHSNAGQLNTYINYFKHEVMRTDDNPPVGILLGTDKNQTLVQYATAGMDSQLFVSKYLLELPAKQVLEKFIQKEVNKF